MKTKNASRSIVLAVGLTLAIVAWMATGLLLDDDTTAATGSREAQSQGAERVRSVSVRSSEARTVTREILISGRSEPNRTVEVKAEAEGRVASVDSDRGARIDEGERIVGLDMRDRAARLTEAEALVAQRELEFEAARQLRGRDLMSEAQIAEAEAQLAAARAALERIDLELERTSIEAPFNGFLAEREVELGDYVAVGDPIGVVVDTDPLIIVGDVSERELYGLDVGTEGTAGLLSGDVVAGTVRYVAPVADESTRTFRIELAIPNPEGELRAGMSAEVRLPAGDIVAHQMTPALLTLDDDGNIGVKTVDEQNTVRFFPVEIVRSGNDGVWVTGLPARVRVITVGQGFVAAGEVVKPVAAAEGSRVSGHSESSSAPLGR